MYFRPRSSARWSPARSTTTWGLSRPAAVQRSVRPFSTMVRSTEDRRFPPLEFATLVPAGAPATRGLRVPRGRWSRIRRPTRRLLVQRMHGEGARHLSHEPIDVFYTTGSGSCDNRRRDHEQQPPANATRISIRAIARARKTGSRCRCRLRVAPAIRNRSSRSKPHLVADRGGGRSSTLSQWSLRYAPRPAVSRLHPERRRQRVRRRFFPSAISWAMPRPPPAPRPAAAPPAPVARESRQSIRTAPASAERNRSPSASAPTRVVFKAPTILIATTVTETTTCTGRAGNHDATGVGVTSPRTLCCRP